MVVFPEADLLDARQRDHGTKPKQRLSGARRHELEKLPLLFGAHLVNDLPQPLDEQEIDALITESINDAKATSMRDMGKVMSVLRPAVQSRVDMAALSAKIKALLS